MTGLDNILKQIELDAKCRADEIKAKADAEAKRIIDDATAEARKISESYEQMADSQSKTVAERAKVADESDAKRAVLRKKQELIKATLETAKAEIKVAKASDYFGFLSSVLKINVQNGEGWVILNENDLKDMTPEFETLLTEKKLKAKSGNVSKRNGFVIIYGSIEINCTIDAIFDARAEEISDSLNSFLFGSEGGI